MKYKLSVVITPLSEGGFMARCERVRATAMGDTCDEAVENLREAVDDLVREYGEVAVFQDISPESEVQVIEVAL
ncbi:MAG: hypothetical protein JW883_03960 [Deltaproteobacteria bacterium]|nr:hypothetical protein [Deltaproteobacteria bacterium]